MGARKSRRRAQQPQTPPLTAVPPVEARSRARRFAAHLFAPVDLASLAIFRMALGVILLVEVFRYAGYGWIARYYIDPTYHFTYPHFGWVKPWPGVGMYVHFAVLGVLAVCIATGLLYRYAMALFALGITYVFLLDETQYLNHIYLVCLLCFLMVCVPGGRLWALDAKLGWAPRSNTTPRWVLWLIVGQLSLVYFFGGVAKLDSDWLTGAPGSAFLTNWELTSPLAGIPWAAKTFALIGMGFDLLIAPALLWRRTRLWATGAVAVFHLTNARLFSIGIFPWLMLAATVLFYPPGWPRRLFQRRAPQTASTETPPRLQRLILAALAAWFAVQIYLPLRHWQYPGEVNWTERGHNYSWHMKLRNKWGEIRMFAVNPETQEGVELDLRDHLNRRQLRKMATRPHMIQQFAQHLGRQLHAETGVPMKMHVHSEVSLNGRDLALMIDPTVDLMTATPDEFILPMPDTPPRLANADED